MTRASSWNLKINRNRVYYTYAAHNHNHLVGYGELVPVGSIPSRQMTLHRTARGLSLFSTDMERRSLSAQLSSSESHFSYSCVLAYLLSNSSGMCSGGMCMDVVQPDCWSSLLSTVPKIETDTTAWKTQFSFLMAINSEFRGPNPKAGYHNEWDSRVSVWDVLNFACTAQSCFGQSSTRWSQEKEGRVWTTLLCMSCYTEVKSAISCG